MPKLSVDAAFDTDCHQSPRTWSKCKALLRDVPQLAGLLLTKAAKRGEASLTTWLLTHFQTHHGRLDPLVLRCEFRSAALRNDVDTCRVMLSTAKRDDFCSGVFVSVYDKAVMHPDVTVDVVKLLFPLTNHPFFGNALHYAVFHSNLPVAQWVVAQIMNDNNALVDALGKISWHLARPFYASVAMWRWLTHVCGAGALIQTLAQHCLTTCRPRTCHGQDPRPSLRRPRRIAAAASVARILTRTVSTLFMVLAATPTAETRIKFMQFN